MDLRNKKIDVRFGSTEKPEGVTKAQAVLFCRVHDMKSVKSGSKIKLDGRLYLVGEATLIQEQIWRISLEGNIE